LGKNVDSKDGMLLLEHLRNYSFS
jgi:hypothetical protein